jgi:hypothetical protein
VINSQGFKVEPKTFTSTSHKSLNHLSFTLAPYSSIVGQAQGARPDFDGHPLAFLLFLSTPPYHHLCSGAGHGTQMLLRCSHISCYPVPFDGLIRHQSLRMVDAAHQMLFLLPDSAPDCHIVEASIHDPTHRHALFQVTYGLADLVQPALNLQ